MTLGPGPRRHVAAALLALVAAACSRPAPAPSRSAPAAETSATGEGATPPLDDPPEARAAREALVREVVAAQGPWGGGAWDRRVVEAMRRVPRHLYMPGASLRVAYADRPAPIGHDQTISQPTVVALMTHALELRGGERVLEIGTGSGYQAAILAVLAREIYSIEIVAPLGQAARERLRALGHENVHVKIGDGYRGWPEHAPFDRVLLTAAPPEVPRALLDQLADGGVLVAPVGEGDVQRLVRWRRKGAAYTMESLGAVRFVPMVRGEETVGPR